MVNIGLKTAKKLDKRQLCIVLVLISYLLQGTASLIYQVSLEQAMEKIVGMALPTAAMIVAIFFAGMAFGAFILSKGKLSAKWAAELYVVNQFSLFIFGLIFIASNGLSVLNYFVTENYHLIAYVYAARLFCVALFLFALAVLIGAGFPLVLRLVTMYRLNLSAEAIYLFNLLGAITGAVCSGFFLLPNFGLAQTTFIGAIINLIAGLIILLANRILTSPTSEPYHLFCNQPSKFSSILSAPEENIVPNDEADSKANQDFYLFASVIASAAFFNLLLELLFVRVQTIVLGSSNLAFSLVSATQLFSLACGAYFACAKDIHIKQRKQEKRDVLAFFGSFFLVAGSWMVLVLLTLPRLSMVQTAVKQFFSLCLPASIAFLFSSLIILLFTLFITCFALGAVLPFYFQYKENEARSILLKTDQAYALNLFFSVLGCFAGGVVILPLLSRIGYHAIYSALILCTIAILLIGIFFYKINKAQAKIWAVSSVCFAVIIILILQSNQNLPVLVPVVSNLQKENKQKIVFYKEGANATVSVLVNTLLNIVYLQTDKYIEAALPLKEGLPAPTSDKTTQVLLGVLPVVFSSGQIKEIFLLGYGAGVTAHAILTYPDVKKLTVAELEPAVIEAAQFFNPTNLKDKRMKIKITDGRNRLSMFEHKYDVIVSQPGEPGRDCSAHLFTYEFWQLVKSRLEPNGVFCQWLPLYGVDKESLFYLCKTFISVFPNTFVFKPEHAGELILLGYNTEKSMTLNSVQDYIQFNSYPLTGDTLKIGFNTPNDLLNIICITPQSFPKWLASFAIYNKDNQDILNTDDFPRVKYRLQSTFINSKE